MLLLSFLFLRDEIMEPGYNTVIIPDAGKKISLNYTLDYIFLFDYPTTYQVKVKFLDMIESETINPSFYGFSGQFLTEVEMKPSVKGSHVIQLFSLPKNFCSHNYVSYFSDQHQTTNLHWSNTKKEYFQICYFYQFPEKQAKLTAKLISNSFSNASYILPQNYARNNFTGTAISKFTEFDLSNGIIVRIQGYSSLSPSNFELSIKPKKSQSTNLNNFASIPFYFILTPDGYRFEDDLEVQFQTMRERLVKLHFSNILGIALSALILLVVIASTTVFFLKKFNCIKNKKKII